MNKSNNSLTFNHSSFVKQGAILAAAGILSRVLGFILRVPISHYLGDDGSCIYNDGYSIYNFALILSSAGLPAAISKMVSERLTLGKREEAHKIFKTSLICSAFLGLLASLVLVFGADVLANQFKNPQSYYTIIALSPTLFIVAIMAVFRGYFQGMHSTVPTAASQIIEQIFNVIFSIVLMLSFMKMTLPPTYRFFDDKLALGAAGGQLGTGVGAMAGLVFILILYFAMRPVIIKGLKKSPDYNVKKSSSLAKELFMVAVPIIAGTAVFSFSNLIDTAMVKGRMLEAGFTLEQALEQYGIYGSKFVTLTTLPVSISAALATAIIPSIAASSVLNAKNEVKSKIDSALRISMLISVPAAVGLGVLADPIIKLVFRSTPNGWEFLAIGSVSVIFLALTQIAAGILQGVGKIYVPVIAAACGVVVKIPLNYVLCAIPEINIYGAVISTIACYIVASGVNIFMLSRVTKTKPDFVSILLKPLVASIGMGAVCFGVYHLCRCFVHSNTVSTIAATAVGVVSYIIFISLIKGINESDLKIMPFGKKLSRLLKTPH